MKGKVGKLDLTKIKIFALQKILWRRKKDRLYTQRKFLQTIFDKRLGSRLYKLEISKIGKRDNAQAIK